MNYKAWYDEIFPKLYRNGLWLRGGELNTMEASRFDAAAFRVLITRLSTYEDTANSFTHQFLYQIAAHTPGVFSDLAYLPPRQDVPLFEQGHIPWLIGTQTKCDALEFDLIAVSNSIVQELLNLPHFLLTSGIPLSKKERLARADVPLVILGGANALYSSCVSMGESLVDGVFVGEDPQAIRSILQICKTAKVEGRSKAETLARLCEIAGFFEPGSHAKVGKSFIANLNHVEALEDAPILYNEDSAGSSNLQISEGCPCFCSFCAESWDRKPYRERSAEVLLETALRQKAAMGLDSIDLYSFNFNMHSEIYQLFWDLVPAFRNIGLMSQRFDLLGHDTATVEYQHAVGKSSFTCGLEGVSPRLRAYLHKNLADRDLYQSMTAIMKAKARELKVFLIATGLEEDQDFAAFGEFLDRVQQMQQQAHSSTRFIFSMTPLVRFPWTPLEFEDAPQPAKVSAVISRVARLVKGAGFEFRESAELPEYWVSQILVRVDRAEVGQALISAVQKTGFAYYREITEAFRAAFEQELKTRGLEPLELFKGFSLAESGAKPWAQVQTGVKREFLWEEYQRAQQFEEVDYCLGRPWAKAHCFHCGGCPTRFHTRDIVLARQKKSYALEQLKARMKIVRESECDASLLVDVGRTARGLPRKFVGAALARALMLSEPALRRYYRGFKDSYWQDEAKPVWVTGLDRVTLRFTTKGVELLMARIGDAKWVAAVNEMSPDWVSLYGVAPENWTPTLLTFSGVGDCKPDKYLAEKALKHTLRKQGEAEYRYEILPQIAKKGFVKGLARRSSEGRFKCAVQIGPKFGADDAHEFATKTGPMEWVRTEIICR